MPRWLLILLGFVLGGLVLGCVIVGGFAVLLRFNGNTSGQTLIPGGGNSGSSGTTGGSTDVVPPTAPPATGSGNCQGQQQPSHDPNSGNWTLSPGNGYLIVHFWTNLAGHSQQERVLELKPSDGSVTLRGGGSAWLYGSNCGGTADHAFSNDSQSFPPVTLDQLRSEGLVA